MPSKDAHLAAARENQRAIDYLCERMDDFPAWITTIAFYKALHVVEALFEVDGAGIGGHTDRHEQRNAVLKKTKRYQNLWRHYRPLFQASLIARYLRENQDGPNYEIFSRYMPPEQVMQLALNHHLRQIETSSTKLAEAAGADFHI